MEDGHVLEVDAGRILPGNSSCMIVAHFILLLVDVSEAILRSL
jgi:hypothetical protein